MKRIPRRRALIAASLTGVLALGTALAGCSTNTAHAEDGKSLTVWEYEDPASAAGKAWAKAIEIFKKEHPGVKVDMQQQGFGSTKNNAKIILTGNDTPDVMEYNKGAASTGLLASLGLLTPLTKEAHERGWDKLLDSASLQVLSRYNKNGMPGTGDWYGIPNYGEYILWYYNKDFFAKHKLQVPKTYDQLIALFDKIKSLGVTPVSASAREFPIVHTWFTDVLRDAPADWVKCYQLFQCPVDWSAPYWLKGTKQTQDLVKKGYIAKDVTGINQEDMGVGFMRQEYPLMLGGSWWYGRLDTEAKFDWGIFAEPSQNLNEGSVGNLWVVPKNAKNKELAYDFIDITMRPEIQDYLGQLGGLPLAGDPAKITDPRTREFTQIFQGLTSQNKLALYPDFPIPGYVDEIISEGQSLMNNSKTPQQALKGIRQFYDSHRKDIISGQ